MNDPGPYYRPPGMAYRPPRRFHWLPIIIGVVFAVVAILLLLILFYPTTFGLSAPSGTYHYYPFGGLFIVFFVVIVLFFIVRVSFWSVRSSRYGRRYGGGAEQGYGPNRPAMIARMRYAKGEITREQYDQIMRDLGRRPGQP